MTEIIMTQTYSDKPVLPKKLQGLFFLVLIANIVFLLGVAFATSVKANLMKPKFKGAFDSMQRNYKEPRSWEKIETDYAAKEDIEVLNITRKE